MFSGYFILSLVILSCFLLSLFTVIFKKLASSNIFYKVSDTFFSTFGMAIPLILIEQVYYNGILFGLIICLSPLSWILLFQIKKKGLVDFIFQYLFININNSHSKLEKLLCYFARYSMISLYLASVAIQIALIISLTEYINNIFQHRDKIIYLIIIFIVLLFMWRIKDSPFYSFSFKFTIFNFAVATIFFILIFLQILTKTNFNFIQLALDNKNSGYLSFTSGLALIFVVLVPNIFPFSLKTLSKETNIKRSKIFQGLSVLQLIFVFMIFTLAVICKARGIILYEDIVLLNFALYYVPNYFVIITSVILIIISIFTIINCITLLQNISFSSDYPNDNADKIAIYHRYYHFTITVISGLFISYSFEYNLSDMIWFAYNIWQPFLCLCLGITSLQIKIRRGLLIMSLSLSFLLTVIGFILSDQHFSPLSIFFADLGILLPLVARKIYKIFKSIEINIHNLKIEYYFYNVVFCHKMSRYRGIIVVFALSYYLLSLSDQQYRLYENNTTTIIMNCLSVILLLISFCTNYLKSKNKWVIQSFFWHLSLFFALLLTPTYQIYLSEDRVISLIILIIFILIINFICNFKVFLTMLLLDLTVIICDFFFISNQKIADSTDIFITNSHLFFFLSISLFTIIFSYFKIEKNERQKKESSYHINSLLKKLTMNVTKTKKDIHNFYNILYHLDNITENREGITLVSLQQSHLNLLKGILNKTYSRTVSDTELAKNILQKIKKQESKVIT